MLELLVIAGAGLAGFAAYIAAGYVLGLRMIRRRELSSLTDLELVQLRNAALDELEFRRELVLAWEHDQPATEAAWKLPREKELSEQP